MPKLMRVVILLVPAAALVVAPTRASAGARFAGRPWHGRLSPLASDPGMSAEQSEEVEKIGNLVADDEYLGLSMELAELVRTAVVEDLKKNTRELIGKEDYKVGDISKAVDAKVKSAVADLRGKDEYELGDLSLALDKIAKDYTCELTGKDEYEFGHLLC